MASETCIIFGKKYCVFCKKEATYDGKTEFGPWAYMCQNCFDKYGIGLGIGKGQKLIEVKYMKKYRVYGDGFKITEEIIQGFEDQGIKVLKRGKKIIVNGLADLNTYASITIECAPIVALNLKKYSYKVINLK